MKLIKSPKSVNAEYKTTLFLAGSIEMDTAVNWQDTVISHFSKEDICILNPRRDEWDSSWKQTIYDENFRGQVEWELDGQELADIIPMYFDPDTKSPITLMELGLFAESGKIIVCCPEGFWRKGNIEIVCDRYDIPLSTDFDFFLKTIESKIKDF